MFAIIHHILCLTTRREARRLSASADRFTQRLAGPRMPDGRSRRAERPVGCSASRHTQASALIHFHAQGLRAQGLRAERAADQSPIDLTIGPRSSTVFNRYHPNIAAFNLIFVGINTHDKHGHPIPPPRECISLVRQLKLTVLQNFIFGHLFCVLLDSGFYRSWAVIFANVYLHFTPANILSKPMSPLHD